MTSRQGRDGQGGFILIESIAVLLLGGLVLLTLLIATSLVTRNSSAATRRANAVEGLSTGLAALRRDLSGALFTRGGGTPEDPLLFDGGPRAVTLAVGAGGGEGQVDSLVRVETRYQDGRGLLVRSSARLSPDTEDLGGAGFSNPVILLSGPWTYRFSYGAAGAQPMQWRESWSAARVLPNAVRLEILGADDGRQVFTPLVVPLKVNAEAKCVPTEEEPCDEDSEDDGSGFEDEDEDNGSDEQ